MKCFKFILVAFVFALAGCNKDNRIVTYSSFPAEETLHLEQIELPDTAYMKLPYRMAQSGNLFFIMDLRASEYHVQCYSYPDFKYLKSLFYYGQGPDDFFQLYSIQCTGDTLFAYDLSIRKLACIALNELNVAQPTVKSVKYSTDLGFLSGCVKINNYFYLNATSLINGGRIVKLDRDGNLLSSFGEIRLDNNDEVDNPTAQAWNSHVAGNEDILVSVTQFGEVMDIYYLKENRRQVTVKGKGGDPVFQKRQNAGVADGIYGFECVAVTKTHIYAVYNGEKVSGSHEYRIGGQYIYVYDYNGNPVKKITLDKFIACIYIDEAESMLYALNVNEDQQLFKVKLTSN
jgi:hypothetical protein